EVDLEESRFAFERALPDYSRALAACWVAAGAKPAGEVCGGPLWRAGPVRTTLPPASCTFRAGAAGISPTVCGVVAAGLAAADGDPWRRAVRGGRSKEDRPALEGLARKVSVAVQRPELLTIVGHVLISKGAFAPAVGLLRRAQLQYPGDFWVNLMLA